MSDRYQEPWNVNSALTVKPTQLYTGGQVNAGDYTNSGYDFNSNSDGGLFSDLTGSDWMDAGMGIGQLGLGLFNYLGNRDVQKAQIKGLNQSVDQSKYAMQRSKDLDAANRKAFA